VDALHSTVQMPAGVPVATMAIGKPGAINAAILAAQILAAGGDRQVAVKLRHYKQELAKKVAARSRKVQEQLAKELGGPA